MLAKDHLEEEEETEGLNEVVSESALKVDDINNEPEEMA